MNKSILIGRLGQDPEMRASNAGLAICSMRMATSERRKSDGEWSEHTEWHSVSCFGKTAENCGKYLAKGSQLAVEGRIQTRKWQDKEGNQRYSTEIVAERVEFLGSKQEPSAERQRQAPDDDSGMPF